MSRYYSLITVSDNFPLFSFTLIEVSALIGVVDCFNDLFQLYFYINYW